MYIFVSHFMRYTVIYVSLVATLKIGFLMNYIFNIAQSQGYSRTHTRQPACQNLFNIFSISKINLFTKVMHFLKKNLSSD